MDKQIYLPDEKKNELAETFKVSRQTVWAALNYRTEKGWGPILRKAALERGGIPLGVDPEFTTIFLTAEKLMVQTFTDRIKLVADLETGEVKVYQDEEVIESYEKTDLTQLLAIQQKVQNIVNQLN